MRTIIVTKDNALLSQIKTVSAISEDKLQVFNAEDGTSLDIMSAVCSTNPGLLIIDDDWTGPETGHLLRSIRKVNKKVKIIFITSDDSLEKGRSIMPLDIHYYGMKPLNENELHDALQSVVQISKYF
jgi:DNA-binding NarL/FixJ family response regulator